MSSVAEKIRQSRESTVEVNGVTFKYRRPTDIQMATMYAEGDGKYSKYEVANKFVYDWDMKESALYKGGGTDRVKFDHEDYTEWLSDSRDYWDPLYKAIMESYVSYSTLRDEEVKN